MSEKRTVRIGFKDYTVNLTKALEDDNRNLLHGKIHYGSSQLHLNTDNEAQTQWQTLLHEAIHGILMEAGFNRDEHHDELWLDCVTSGICRFLRDNPCAHSPAALTKFLK